MRVYSPWDEAKAFLHDNTPYELAANGDAELPEEVGAHAVKRFGATGIVALTGDPKADSGLRATAEARHDEYLKQRAAEIGLAPVAKEHPDAAAVRGAIQRRAKRAGKGKE